MVQARTWLNWFYPEQSRKKIKNLYLRDKNLEGCLDLSDFINLKKLDCSHNHLTNLDLSNLKHLKVVYCDSNYLENLEFVNNLHPQNLTSLIINNNNFPEQNIKIFNQFTNLEELRVGNTDKRKIQEEHYNRFFGSLEFLKKLTRLEDLDISNTDINNGVEYLPVSVKRISYSTSQRTESKVKEITEQLKTFLLSRKIEEDWGKIHLDFDREKQMCWESLRFSYQQSKEWIDVGLRPSDYYFASYLREKCYQPSSEINLEQLRKENKNAQNYLDKEYLLEARRWTNWLDISKKGLEGNLIIENWPNLEKLDCYHNHLTNLTLNNCPNLTRIVCSQGTITNLNITNCPEINNLNVSDNLLINLDFLTKLNPDKLVYLYLTNNKFSEQEDIVIFGKFVNLKYIYLANNNFIGNLQHLKNLESLQTLSIIDTKINSGFEYLPDSLNEIASNVFQELEKVDSTNFKVVRWANLMKKSGYQRVPYYDFHYWKENNKELIKLFTSSDKIAFIQSEIKSFFNLWTKYLLKQQKLVENQKLSTWAWRAKLISAGTGMITVGFGYNQGLSTTLISTFGLFSGALVGVSEYTIKNTEEKIKDLEKKLSRREMEFQQETKKLKINYEKLIEIWKDLSLLSKFPTKSFEVNKVFNDILSIIADLEKEMKLIKRNGQQVINGEYIVLDMIDEVENDLKESKEIIEFAWSLKINWEKHKIIETISNLTKKINDYRQEIYKCDQELSNLNLEKPLPSLPNDNQQININNQNQFKEDKNNVNLKSARAETSSSRQQINEHQAQTLQQTHLKGV